MTFKDYMVIRHRSRNRVPAADNISNQQIRCKRASSFTEFSHYMPIFVTCSCWRNAQR
jgi:hypothetical protein